MSENDVVPIREAFRGLSSLDAKEKLVDPTDPLHAIPRWNEDQYFCMEHTKEGKTAFDNATCVHCAHKNEREVIYCVNCTSLLSKPTTLKNVRKCVSCDEIVTDNNCVCGSNTTYTVKERKLIRAFRTAYKRMSSDCVASTLTTNSGVISSDVKGHPTQNRVLSVREILIAASVAPHASISYPWWEAVKGVFDTLPHALIRDVIGESIPPLALQQIVAHLLKTREEPLH